MISEDNDVIIYGVNDVGGQVGDGETDHSCWQRPEDMTTSRRAYKVDEANPGTEVAEETAAALAAASIVFRRTNPHYSNLLLEHAHQVSFVTEVVRRVDKVFFCHFHGDH